MESFQDIVSLLTGWLWGPWMLIFLLGTGIYFSIGIKFLQIRKIKYVFGQTLGRMFANDADIPGEGTLLPSQAAFSALASTIGVGNIVGVSTALALGGPGALFWMWVAGFVGMGTKYAEIVLSVNYREKDPVTGYFQGGPPWYMQKGVNSRTLAVVFAVALAFVCISGGMIQANAIAQQGEKTFGIETLTLGLVLCVLVGLVTLGGIKRLGRVAGKLVPAMALLYVFAGLAVILVNVSSLPNVLYSIFAGAFSPTSLGGGVAGVAFKEAIKFGVQRGLYSNEAGEGTAPIAYATAKTDHPVRTGLWGITGIFLDTFVACSITGLTVLSSGVMSSADSPAVFATRAFGTVSPGFEYAGSIALIVFAYTTILTVSYYGETMARYLGGNRVGLFYRFVFLPFIIVGAVGGLQFIWSLQTLLLGVATIPNLVAILILSPKVFSLTKEFFEQPQTRSAELQDS